MPTLIEKPSVIEAVGNKPKRIEEYAGRVNTRGHRLSRSGGPCVAGLTPTGCAS